MKDGAKRSRKCKNAKKSAKDAMRMRNANAMRKRCDAMRTTWTKVRMQMRMRKTFRTTIPARKQVQVYAQIEPFQEIERVHHQ